MTIHYEVQLDFRELPSAIIMQANDMSKAIRQMAEIKEYLGLPVLETDLKIIDESTSRFNPRSRRYQPE